MRVVSTGHLTFGEANKVKNQLLEDMPLEDGERFEIGCYMLKGDLRYCIEVIDAPEQAAARAEWEEDR